MTTFDERKNSFEAKFAHDQELRFKAEARRNRLIGEWVAAQLGLAGDDVANYVREVRRADLQEAGDEDVFRKVRADFESAGIAASDSELRAKMSELMAVAIEQVTKD